MISPLFELWILQKLVAEHWLSGPFCFVFCPVRLQPLPQARYRAV
jgi:hypothetical protein